MLYISFKIEKTIPTYFILTFADFFFGFSLDVIIEFLAIDTYILKPWLCKWRLLILSWFLRYRQIKFIFSCLLNIKCIQKIYFFFLKVKWSFLLVWTVEQMLCNLWQWVRKCTQHENNITYRWPSAFFKCFFASHLITKACNKHYLATGADEIVKIY